MGHRANYAIVEGGSVSLYYSHWGAKTIPADVFWGPAIAETFIRANTLTDEWLDSTFAEGGIALDKDRRCALFHGDAELLDTPQMWSLFLYLAGRVWAEAGWRLEAGKNQGDMAEFCGVSRASVEPPEAPPIAFPLHKLGENYAQGFVCALIGHKHANGFEDRVLDYSLWSTLLNGPVLIPRLAELPTLDQVRAGAQQRRPRKTVFQRWKERLIDGAPANLPPGAIWDKRTKRYTFPPPPYGEAIGSFAILDETTLVLEVFDPHGMGKLEWVKKAWSGWTVIPLERLEGYFRRTGRVAPSDLTPTQPFDEEVPVRSRTECLAEIERHILGGEEQKEYLSKLAHKLRAEYGTPGAKFAEGLFDKIPALPLTESQRREIWAKLLASE